MIRAVATHLDAQRSYLAQSGEVGLRGLSAGVVLARSLWQRRMPVFYIWWNTLFPFIDLAYTIGFIPGIVLALFGVYWIVGPMTLALLPMALLMNLLMYSRSKATFDELGLTVRRNRWGLAVYAAVYSLLLQPACVWGYISEWLNFKKTWGTK